MSTRALRFLMISLVVALSVGACSRAEEATPRTSAVPTTSSAPSDSSTTAAPTTTTTEAPFQKPYGGVARIVEAVPDAGDLTLNPLIRDNGFREAYQVGMWKLDWQRLDMVPDVVTELPTFANGGLTENADGTVTVRLDILPEAAWADGVSISGDDFAFTHQLHAIPELGKLDLYEMVDADSLVIGPKSFEFTLTTLIPGWETLFFVIVPKHDVEGSDFLADWNDRMWVSGAPFRFAGLVPEGDFLALERNPNYWRKDPETGQQLPYLDRIEVGYRDLALADAAYDTAPAQLVDTLRVRFEEGGDELSFEEFEATEIVLEQVRLDALLRGDIDSSYFDMLPFDELAETAAPLQDSGDVGGGLLETLQWEWLGLNLGPRRFEANDESWNEHLDFRRAVAFAIDRDRLAEAAWGIARSGLDSYVEMYSPSLSSGAWGRYAHDPDLARELLAGLCERLGRDCVTDPPRLVLAPWPHPHRIAAAEELTTQLGAVGIEVAVAESADPWCGAFDGLQLAFVSSASWWDLIYLHAMLDPASPPLPFDPAANLVRWGTPAIDFVEGEEADCYNSGPSAVVDEHTERMAQIVAEMRSTIDPARLRPLVAEAEDILADQVVFIPLYAHPRWLLWNPDLAGFGMRVANTVQLWNSAEWYRTDL